MQTDNESNKAIDGEVVEDNLIVTGQNSREITSTARSQFQQGVPLTREALEILEEFQDLAQAVAAGFVKTTKPGDLAAAGVVFDITDAWLTDFTENGKTEKKVCFTLVEHETSVVHTVMQSDDSKGIRRKYATLYSRAKALGITAEPLRNYRFVATEKTFANNNVAYVLERAPQQVGAGSGR